MTVPPCLTAELARMHSLKILKPPVEIPAFTMCQGWREIHHNDPGHRGPRHALVNAGSRKKSPDYKWYEGKSDLPNFSRTGVLVPSKKKQYSGPTPSRQRHRDPLTGRRAACLGEYVRDLKHYGDKYCGFERSLTARRRARRPVSG
jgi:hypothetical protein